MELNVLIAIIVALIIIALIVLHPPKCQCNKCKECLRLKGDNNTNTNTNTNTNNENFSVLDGRRGVRSLEGNMFLQEVIGKAYRFTTGDKLYFQILPGLPRRQLVLRGEGLYLSRGRYDVDVLTALKDKIVLQLHHRRMGLPIIMTILRPKLVRPNGSTLKVICKHPLYPERISYVVAY